MTSEATLKTTSPLYELSPRLIGGSLDSTSVPFTFETPAQAWHYTVSFNRVGSPQESADPIMVRVTLDVLSGQLAVGVLQGASSIFLDETIVGVGERRVADILVGDPASAGQLMVRNGPVDAPSRGRILAIDTFTVNVELSASREPGLSYPTPTPQWNRVYGIGQPTLIEKARARAFDSLTAPQVVRWSDGLSFRVVPNDQISRALYVSSSYEPNTLLMLRKFLPAGGVCLDVGANAGVFSVVAARCVGAGGHVYSFEPSEREFHRLRDVVQLNHLEGIVTPIRAAVGAHAGQETLRIAAEPYSGLNTLGGEFSYEGIETARLESIEMTTLDEFARHGGLARVDLIKLDIEGAESAALVGASDLLRRHRPVLVIELFSRSLASNGAGVADIEGHLRNADYRPFAIDDETADLIALTDLTAIDEQNIVAIPSEKT